jgi:hypothetical protein
MNRHLNIPDWKLERYLLEELPPDEMTFIRQEATQNNALGGRLEALVQANQAMHAQHPPAWMARQIRMKAERHTRETHSTFGRFWSYSAMSVAAIVLLIVGLPMVYNQDTTVIHQVEPGIRLKGLQPGLQIFRKTETGVERLAPGAQVREHDLLQIKYQAAGQTYGVILSTDGHGAVTLHLPYEGTQAAQLNQEAAYLDYAYELDDAPNWEKFYFITSKEAFIVESVILAARQRLAAQSTTVKEDSLDLPDTLDQMIILLRKESRDD